MISLFKPIHFDTFLLYNNGSEIEILIDLLICHDIDFCFFFSRFFFSFSFFFYMDII